MFPSGRFIETRSVLTVDSPGSDRSLCFVSCGTPRGYDPGMTDGPVGPDSTAY